MPATYSKQKRVTRAPLSPQTILARLLVLTILVGLFVSVFVLPWLFN